MSDLTAPAFHWLVTGQIITEDKAKVEFLSRPLNVMVITDEHRFARRNMARAQEALLQRFTTLPQIRGRTIKDVVLTAVSPLGFMSAVEFNEGMGPPPAAEPVAEPVKEETVN